MMITFFTLAVRLIFAWWPIFLLQELLISTLITTIYLHWHSVEYLFI